MKMLTIKIFTGKSIHGVGGHHCKKQGGGKDKLWGHSLSGKNTYKKICTRRNDHSKNMHKEENILGKKTHLVFKTPTETYPE